MIDRLPCVVQLFPRRRLKNIAGLRIEPKAASLSLGSTAVLLLVCCMYSSSTMCTKPSILLVQRPVCSNAVVGRMKFRRLLQFRQAKC